MPNYNKISIDNTNPVPQSSPEVLSVMVCNCERLNVRKKPDLTSEVVFIVNAKTILTVRVVSTDWARVYNGSGRTIGYVIRKFIKEN